MGSAASITAPQTTSQLALEYATAPPRERGVASVASNKAQMVRCKVLLRHPTNNVPDKFFQEIFFNAVPGAVVKGNKYHSIENFTLTNLPATYASGQDAPNPGVNSKTCVYPPQHTLPESRAQAFSVCVYDDTTYLIPASRFHLFYSGITMLLGDTYNKSKVHKIKCGDVIKLGSVSLLITSVAKADGTVTSTPPRVADWLYQAFAKASDVDEEFRGGQSTVGSVATDATEAVSSTGEDMTKTTRFQGTPGKSCGEELESEEQEGEDKMCYVCTDDIDSAEDPIVAPCLCKGGTKWVHVSCLRRWAIKDRDERVCVVASATGDNNYTCGVCRSPYAYETATCASSANKKEYKESGGVEKGGGGAQTTTLFEKEIKAPYIKARVLISSDHTVMPRGDVYNISFCSLLDAQGESGANARTAVSVGRNPENDVVLKCNSVSNFHAKIHYIEDEFYLTDENSSNGTHYYLRGPAKLEKNEEMVIRIGRSTIKLSKADYWKVKLDPSATTLKETQVVKNPNYRASGNLPSDSSLNTVSMIDIDDYGGEDIPRPLKMLMRSMMPVTSAAYIMSLEVYRKKMEGLIKVQEEENARRRDFGGDRDTSYEAEGAESALDGAEMAKRGLDGAVVSVVNPDPKR